MTDIAIHIRIFDAEPTDDLVEKRTNAINDLSDSFFKRKSSHEILQLANDLSGAVATNGSVSNSLASEIETAIKSYSPAFVHAGNELQTLVCALLAILQYLESASPSKGHLLKADVFAAGIWSALSFQPVRAETKLEALRSEILKRSQVMIMETSYSSRKRAEVPDISIKVPEAPDWETYSSAQTKGALKTIKSLRDNATLDREELDLLWWILSDWSLLLNETFSSSPNEAAAIARGIEAAHLLRRLPGDAHKHLVLKGTKKDDPKNLIGLVETLGDNKAKLAFNFQDDSTLEACPAVFPLLSALLKSDPLETTADTKHSLHEWATRALLESAILHIIKLPNPAEL